MRRPNPSSGGMVVGGLLLLVATGIGVAVYMANKDDAEKDGKAGAKTGEENTTPEEGGGKKYKPTTELTATASKKGAVFFPELKIDAAASDKLAASLK